MNSKKLRDYATLRFKIIKGEYFNLNYLTKAQFHQHFYFLFLVDKLREIPFQ